jgi:hypothetical protein
MMSEAPTMPSGFDWLEKWAEDGAELSRRFRENFGDDTEGFMRLLFTINLMAAEIAYAYDIPMEDILDLMRATVAAWHSAGKPARLLTFSHSQICHHPALSGKKETHLCLTGRDFQLQLLFRLGFLKGEDS